MVGLVESMSYVACAHCGEHIDVFHRSERAWAIEEQGVPLLCQVQMDITISHHITSERPLVTAATIFLKVATKVAEWLLAQYAR